MQVQNILQKSIWEWNVRKTYQFNFSTRELWSFPGNFCFLFGHSRIMKRKYLLASQSSFVVKELSNAVMLWCNCRKLYLKTWAEELKFDIQIAKKHFGSKKRCYENLDMNDTVNCKIFWKIVKPGSKTQTQNKEMLHVIVWLR